MKNSGMPAMPIEINGFGQYAPEAHTGLTKREMFAMHAMQGLLASENEGYQYESAEQCAHSSVLLADALLKELEK